MLAGPDSAAQPNCRRHDSHAPPWPLGAMSGSWLRAVKRALRLSVASQLNEMRDVGPMPIRRVGQASEKRGLGK